MGSQGGPIGETADTNSAAPADVSQAWLEQLCQRTDDLLWQSSRFALGERDASWPCFIFPLKGEAGRVSEQEAHFALVAALLADEGSAEWAFAVEVPTRLSYHFTNKEADSLGQRALPIVRRKEEAEYGEYRSQRLILQNYERLKAAEGALEGAET